MSETNPKFRLIILGGYVKALVTGGGGFIGSHLVSLLREKEHDVIAIDTPHFGQKKREDFISVDIRNKEVLAPYLEGGRLGFSPRCDCRGDRLKGKPNPLL